MIILKQVKMVEDVQILISLEVGMTITATLEKDNIYLFIGEFTNEITGEEMVALAEDKEIVPFVIAKKYVEFL